MRISLLTSIDLEKLLENNAQQVESNTQFIDEFLQNADDSKSKNINFSLHKDYICIENDSLLFSHRDVYSICSIDSAKQDKDTIGFFGIGFPSVFRVSDEPVPNKGSCLYCIKEHRNILREKHF